MAALALIASTAFQAIGAIQNISSAGSAERYNAQVLENQASTVNQQTTVRQEAQRSQARQVIGQQLAAGSESGAGLSGSNLDLLGESLYNSEMDALNIRYEGTLNAQGLQKQAEIERFKGKQAQRKAYMSATGTLLSAGSSFFGGGAKLPGFSGTQAPAAIVDKSFR